ncbi:hypothetical protein [Bradyrhizobium japonicum]|uniref:hypothetical protein n=1 Tax=Bradyrhizobium japonicum TaxID=375 RepID=UPI0020A0220A|nr:hypothetical protein [Bradyrhizobium japonicum]MCP1765406.1 hypothetical protein [Bradyrhizobium japonicum]MCP1787544.1 hypothetical protein [Bradyrhizobium japonicum]MCP1809420.1 hypothetical protein [Bradyrhizobium japonicum]MCP1818353.1 hypothetical protein [Bradyrhizobium japonicum]MCP1870137.1 hypothetical protein [Bradyrhizobium japonicum]
MLKSDISVETGAATRRINIDPTSPFAARLYYMALRDLGANPLVCQQPDGSLGLHITLGAANGVGEDSALNAWAHNCDQDQSLRRKFENAEWKYRPEGAEVVLLGV